MEEEKTYFRFQGLEIWQEAVASMKTFYKIIHRLEDIRNFRIASQLEGAVLSISNNIAEGAGSRSNADFRRYLGYARSSIFECANIIIVLNELNHIDNESKNEYLIKLDQLSKKIVSFSNSLPK
jgi:four helix bundle protein